MLASSEPVASTLSAKGEKEKSVTLAEWPETVKMFSRLCLPTDATLSSESDPPPPVDPGNAGEGSRGEVGVSGEIPDTTRFKREKEKGEGGGKENELSTKSKEGENNS